MRGVVKFSMTIARGITQPRVHFCTHLSIPDARLGPSCPRSDCRSTRKTADPHHHPLPRSCPPPWQSPSSGGRSWRARRCSGAIRRRRSTRCNCTAMVKKGCPRLRDSAFCHPLSADSSRNLAPTFSTIPVVPVPLVRLVVRRQ